MSISIADVKKSAKLARLHLCEDSAQLVKLQGELSSIIDWVQTLNQVDIKGVDPLINPAQDYYDQIPARQDVVTDGGDVSAVLSNAPEAAHDMYVVPKVVE